MNYLLVGIFLLPIFIFAINQGIIVYILKSRFPEKHQEITKGKMNYHTLSFSKFLYSIREEEDSTLKKLKILNICALSYFMLSFILIIVIFKL